MRSRYTKEGDSQVSRNKVILRFSDRRIRAEKAETFYQRLKGLRFREKGLMFFDLGGPNRAVVDTLFVRDNLYLYFLDEDMEVVETVVLPPNRFHTPEKPYRFLLESFQDLELEKGERIEKM